MRAAHRNLWLGAIALVTAGCQGRSCTADRDAKEPHAKQLHAKQPEQGSEREHATAGPKVAVPEQRLGPASDLMIRYAERTGLTSEGPTRRYLWTDAFAVCNFLGLARATGEPHYRQLARQLIERVHHTLGRHREDDPRSGWLSGLEEAEAERHPTLGGLRIGKDLPERPAGAPLDRQLEWDREGQYFHYLTKWMHALDIAARALNDAELARWSRELAERAYEGFTYERGGELAMHWKMSIDLTRPLVPSMGHHDPLDGLVTYAQLQVTGSNLDGPPTLAQEISGFERMVEGRDWTTLDPLGLGGLFMDATRIAQLGEASAVLDAALLEDLLASAQVGLAGYAGRGELSAPANRRLAFRELGLAIGLYGAAKTAEEGWAPPEAVRGLTPFFPLREKIVSFWLDPAHREAATWTEHRDINEVMLATALAPEGCLLLPQAK